MKNSDVVTSKDPETGRSTFTVRNRPEAFGDWIGFVLLVIASAVLVCVGVVNLGANPVSGVALGALFGALLAGLCARVHYRYR